MPNVMSEIALLSALKCACLFNRVTVVTYLCEHIASNSIPIHNTDGLVFVFRCLCKDDMFCELIVALNECCNMPNTVLDEELLEAINNGKVEVAKTLQKLGAQVDVENIEVTSLNEHVLDCL